jgi:hypothetical protein
MEAFLLSKNPLSELTNSTIDYIPVNDYTTQSEGANCEINAFKMKTEKQGTITVVEHFSGNQSYIDIIKAALRRQFAE